MRGACELTEGKVELFVLVRNRLLLLENWVFALKKNLFVASERPSLVWKNSAQMMELYLPLALSLPAPME